MRALRVQYGGALDHPQEYLSNEHPYDERLAHQFAAIHQAVELERQAKPLEMSSTDRAGRSENAHDGHSTRQDPI